MDPTDRTKRAVIINPGSPSSSTPAPINSAVPTHLMQQGSSAPRREQLNVDKPKDGSKPQQIVSQQPSAQIGPKPGATSPSFSNLFVSQQPSAQISPKPGAAPSFSTFSFGGSSQAPTPVLPGFSFGTPSISNPAPTPTPTQVQPTRTVVSEPLKKDAPKTASQNPQATPVTQSRAATGSQPVTNTHPQPAPQPVYSYFGNSNIPSSPLSQGFTFGTPTQPASSNPNIPAWVIPNVTTQSLLSEQLKKNEQLGTSVGQPKLEVQHKAPLVSQPANPTPPQTLPTPSYSSSPSSPAPAARPVVSEQLNKDPKPGTSVGQPKLEVQHRAPLVSQPANPTPPQTLPTPSYSSSSSSPAPAARPVVSEQLNKDPKPGTSVGQPKLEVQHRAPLVSQPANPTPPQYQQQPQQQYQQQQFPKPNTQFASYPPSVPAQSQAQKRTYTPPQTTQAMDGRTVSTEPKSPSISRVYCFALSIIPTVLFIVAVTDFALFLPAVLILGPVEAVLGICLLGRKKMWRCCC